MRQAQQTASDFYWYHCVDLGNGEVTDGDYAMGQYLPYYQFPTNMIGWSVLDVGCGSGYFAFEFETRGAEVTATEIPSVDDWDFVGGDEEKAVVLDRLSKHDHLDEYLIHGAFKYAHTARNSSVKQVRATVYDLAPELFNGKKFDLVFAGSILSHLKNPILALEHLHSVTKGSCIIAAPFIDIVDHRNLALMVFVGRDDLDRQSCWLVNPKGLEEMLFIAGFKRTSIVSHFNLQHRKKPELVIPHIVAHAAP